MRDKAARLEEGRAIARAHFVSTRERKKSQNIMLSFVVALKRQHKLVAALTSGGDPSYLRGPQTLLDFITFAFAIALLRSWEVHRGGDEDDFQAWRDASGEGFGAFCGQLRDVLVEMVSETLILFWLTSIPHYFLYESMSQREAAERLQVLLNPPEPDR